MKGQESRARESLRATGWRGTSGKFLLENPNSDPSSAQRRILMNIVIGDWTSPDTPGN